MTATSLKIRRRIVIPILGAVFFLCLASFKNDFFEIAKQIEIFTEMYKQLNMNYVDETNPADLMDKAIEGMLSDLDPYTTYWTEQEVERAKINSRGEFTGIGANVSSRADKLIILEPWKDYPADKAGLKAGDEIIAIDGINVSDYKENAGKLLEGAAGTDVSVTFSRQGTTQKAVIKRAAVEIKAVPFFQMATPDIGYVVLSKFNEKASRETKEAIKQLKEKGLI